MNGQRECGVCLKQWIGYEVQCQRKSFLQNLREDEQLSNFIALFTYMSIEALNFLFRIVPIKGFGQITIKKFIKYCSRIISIVIVVSFVFVEQIICNYLCWGDSHFNFVLVETTSK